MSVNRRKDGRWRVDIVIVRGGERIRFRKAAPTRAEALALERSIRSRYEAGERPERRPPAFSEWQGEFLETYAATNNKPSELATKRIIVGRHLVPAFGALRLDEIDLPRIERYKAGKIRAGLAPKTVNNHLTVLRRMLEVAREWGKLGAVPPVRWLKVPPSRFDFLTFDEAARLIEHGRDPWRAMIVLALRTGLRQGELLALRWDDVDLVAGRLVVRRSVYGRTVGTPKSGREREVPLSDDALAALRTLPSRFRGELVFCHDDGSMFTKNGARQPLWGACKRAGLRRIGWHALRHTFASHLVMRGVAIKAVQELLGHATTEMTMRYAHLSPDVRRDAVRLLDLRPPAGPDTTWEVGGKG